MTQQEIAQQAAKLLPTLRRAKGPYDVIWDTGEWEIILAAIQLLVPVAIGDSVIILKADAQFTPTPRKFPKVWAVGMKVQYRENAEWTWDKGSYGIINRLRNPSDVILGDEHQVFFTHPIKEDGTIDKSASFWTTPKDVDWVTDKE